MQVLILSTPPTTWPKNPGRSGGAGRHGSLWPTARLEAAAGWVEALSPPQGGVYLSVIPPAGGAAGGADAPDLRRGRGALRRIEVATRPASRDQVTNDLVSGGRKLCGILTELSLEAESGHVQYAVVGAGVNCDQTLSDFPPEIRDMAGSLSMLTGKAVSRNTLAAEMIRALSRLDGDLVENRQGVDGPVLPGLCHHRPGQVSVSRAGETRGGKRWTWTTGALFWWISARGRRPSSPAKSVYAVCMGTYNVFI